jgi:hypothetical protein
MPKSTPLPKEIGDFGNLFKTLDDLAGIYGLKRKPDETNDELQLRINQVKGEN